MTFKVSIAQSARNQAAAISRWYHQQSSSLEVARQWIQVFRETASSLTNNPERHPLARESDDFSYELREVHFGSGRKKTHRLLFRIDGNNVLVMSVRHFAQDDISADDLA
ncbi:MAG: type II toxin-antitoxin system RelE/ParE family toxin [Planctomycetaceae bacterium]